MKNRTLTTIALVIAIVTGTVVSFLLVTDKNLVFWTSYIFSVLAVAMIYVSSMGFGRKNSNGNTNNFPVQASFSSLALCYLFADIILIVLFTKWIILSAVAYLCIHLVVFAVFSIIGIYQIIGTRAITEDIEKTKNDTVNWKLLCADLQNLVDESNESVKPYLNDLYEKVRYSDPISNPSLADMDTAIKDNIRSLGEIILAKNYTEDTISEKVDSIKELVNQRNRKVQILK